MHQKVGGVSVIGAREFSDLKNSRATFIALIVSGDPRLMKHVDRMRDVQSDMDVHIVAVDSADAHLIPVARVPKLRIHRDGECTHNVALSLDVSSLEDALRRLQLL